MEKEVTKCDNCGKCNQGTVEHLNENWCYDCMRLAGYCLSCDCYMPDVVDDYYNYEHDECPNCYTEHNPPAATVTAKEDMQQDKNFHIRLRAAIEKRLKAHGLVDKHGIIPTHDKDAAYTDKQKREWAFIESLDEITLEFLQGQKSHP